MYRQYADNYTHAVATLNRVMTKAPQVARYIHQLQKTDRCRGLDLPAFLEMPLVHLPRSETMLKVPRLAPSAFCRPSRLTVLCVCAFAGG